MESTVAPAAAPAPRPRPVSRLGPVLWVLIFATLVCYGLLAMRMLATHSTRFAYLFFNLVLAWIPLLLSLLLREVRTEAGWRRGVFWLAGFLWVFFYPNSFYIVTDLVHAKKFGSDGAPMWYDLIVTASFSFAGVFLGCLALYLLHLINRERFGHRTGWVFACAMLALGSMGIYVGRFLRWNSWEVVTQPAKLLGQTTRLVEEYEKFGAFSITFFFFSLMAYFFVVAMARLHEGEV